MMKYFYPDVYVSSIFDIPYDELLSEGIKNILFDIDNTLAPINVPEPGTELIVLFNKLRDMGFSICILSNGGTGRVNVYANALGVPFIAKAGKPFSKGVDTALKILNAGYSDTVIIGDQLFTDILCGKRKKIKTVLVKPISNVEEWYVKLKRIFEKPVLAGYLRKRGYDEKR